VKYAGTVDRVYLKAFLGQYLDGEPQFTAADFIDSVRLEKQAEYRGGVLETRAIKGQ